MPEKMNPEVKALWLQALRSGEYKKCKGKLTEIAPDGTESHCPLGVLTEVAIKAGVPIARNNVDGGRAYYGTPGEYGNSMVTPEVVAVWARLSGSNPYVTWDGEAGHTLAELNDGTKTEELTFFQIADIINQQL